MPILLKCLLVQQPSNPTSDPHAEIGLSIHCNPEIHFQIPLIYSAAPVCADKIRHCHLRLSVLIANLVVPKLSEDAAGSN